MKCPKCQEELAVNAKFCPGCGNPVPQETATRSSGVSVGDVGYFEGNISDASQHGAASVGSINVHVGNNGANAKPAAEPAIVICPLCGRRNHEINTFFCNKCGRDYICLSHQDQDSFMCTLCTPAVSVPEANARAPFRQENNEPAAFQVKQEESIPKQLSNSLGIDFVYIEPGTFMMGSPPNDSERFDEEILHSVALTQGFYLQATPVIQSQWMDVMGINPSYFKYDNKCPVDCVSWEDVQEFILKLNHREERNVYRLPTEAEWEYACRAGTQSPRYGDINRIAWYKANSDNKTHPVAQKQPNNWGLYDTIGNVWELCSDWKLDYQSGFASDPKGLSIGTARVIRGSCYEGNARYCRSAVRHCLKPGFRGSGIGFRLARTP